MAASPPQGYLSANTVGHSETFSFPSSSWIPKPKTQYSQTPSPNRHLTDLLAAPVGGSGCSSSLGSGFDSCQLLVPVPKPQDHALLILTSTATRSQPDPSLRPLPPAHTMPANSSALPSMGLLQGEKVLQGEMVAPPPPNCSSPNCLQRGWTFPSCCWPKEWRVHNPHNLWRSHLWGRTCQLLNSAYNSLKEKTKGESYTPNESAC